MYDKHHASKSFDELTFNRIYPTHEFAYVTAIRAETDTNDLKINPSVITCDSVGTRATNLEDSTLNKLNESIIVNKKDTFNTVKESQIKELLKDPDNISLSLKDDQQDIFLHKIIMKMAQSKTSLNPY